MQSLQNNLLTVAQNFIQHEMAAEKLNIYKENS